MIPVEKTMGAPPYARQVLHWFAATATAALATILLVWLRANSTTAGMVFLVLVVWWAAQAGIALSIYTAVLSAVCFDFFFLLPLHTFRIEGAQQWVAMVSFALSCLVVARLAERARKQTVRAQQREEDVGKLYSLSQEMMLFEDADRLLRDLPGAIGRIFVLDGVVLYVGDYDRFFSSTGEVSSSLRAHMQAVAQGLNPPECAICRISDQRSRTGIETRRRSRVAAGYALARGRNRGVGPGIYRRRALHRHRRFNAHRSRA